MNLSEIIANDPYHRSELDITKVYHGLCNCCRCGCGGKYYKYGERGFKLAISKMSKPFFKPLLKGTLVWVKNHGCSEKSEGVVYGDNYIDIPYDKERDKCYCLYFD